MVNTQVWIEFSLFHHFTREGMGKTTVILCLGRKLSVLGSPLSLQGRDTYSSAIVAKMRDLVVLAFFDTDI